MFKNVEMLLRPWQMARHQASMKIPTEIHGWNSLLFAMHNLFMASWMAGDMLKIVSILKPPGLQQLQGHTGALHRGALH